jgi:PAS domain S-box-containing protein
MWAFASRFPCGPDRGCAEAVRGSSITPVGAPKYDACILQQGEGIVRGLITPSPIERSTDGTTEALITCAMDGRVLTWSRSAESTFGYSTNEAIGKHIHELVLVDDSNGQGRAAFVAAKDLGASSILAVARRKDTTLIDVQVTMQRADAPDGPSFIVCAARPLRPKPPVADLRGPEAKFRDLLETAGSRSSTDRPKSSSAIRGTSSSTGPSKS